jgi:hypothetical protein
VSIGRVFSSDDDEEEELSLSESDDGVPGGDDGEWFEDSSFITGSGSASR